MEATLTWLLDNWDLVVTLIVAAVALLKATAWGKANAKALEIVVLAIEKTGKYAALSETAKKEAVKEVKRAVMHQEIGALPAVADAIKDAVAEVDNKKKPLRKGLVILREVLRGVVRLKSGGVLIVLLCFGLMAGCATAGADGAQRPTITPQQQAQVNRFIGALVSGGIQYYEAKEAVEAERHIYEDAKKTAVQAGGIVAVTAYSEMRLGKSRDVAIADGKAAAEAWCATRGTTIAEVTAIVAKGAPAKVDAGDILEGIVAEQLRYIATQQGAAAP